MKKESVEMLTAVEFAERAGVSYPTVMSWLRKKLIPGAELKQGDPLGTYWAIPATSIDMVKPQKRGPKPKSTSNNADDQTTGRPAPEEKPAKPTKKAGKAESKKAAKKKRTEK
jgi:hypothetical protein